jgi:hypothetical protein
MTVVFLQAQAQRDLFDVIHAIRRWNGIALLSAPVPAHHSQPRHPVTVITTDAAIAWGMGGWIDVDSERRYFAEQWSPDDLLLARGGRSNGDVSTPYLELRAALQALRVFSSMCSHRAVLIRIDNSAAEHDLNSGRSASAPMQALLRDIGLLCLHFSMHVFAEHITSTNNTFADECSRGHIDPVRLQAIAGPRQLIRMFPSSGAQGAHPCGSKSPASSTQI